MPWLEFDWSQRQQFALLWAFTGYDGYGQAKTAAPVQVRVRWITKRRQVMDHLGNVITLDATAVVGQKIDIGSKMWLAPDGISPDTALAWWNGTGSGLPEDELMEVKTYDEAKDLKGRFTRRQVGLMKFRNASPQGQG